MTYTLYGAGISLFSGKARSYLRWKQVDFSEVSTNTDIMKTRLLPVIGWPVIPVLETQDNKFIQDTADIIDHIEAEQSGASVYPEGPVQRFVTELLHLYADQWLTLPAMHYRWFYNETWVLEEFGKLAAPDADRETQIAIGNKRGAMFKAMVPMLGVTPDTAPAIEASYLGFLDEFSTHLETYDFVFGGRPSLADFAFYGPLYAHLYRDPKSGEIMRAHAPKVAAWVERLRDGDYGPGDLIAGDEIPETLYPILRRHNIEHLPVLEATNKLLDQFSGDDLPRALGMAPFEMEGISGQTIARPFSLFRLQRALDRYNPICNPILEKTGGEALKHFKIAKRLERQNYKLAIA